jgi:membrane protein required for colicin V production
MSSFIDFLNNNILLFDIFFIVIIFYNAVKCLTQGFFLSFLSSLKWVVSAIATIVLVPRLQPWVSEYIESEFINNVGIGVFVFIVTLFLSIVLGKSLGRTVKWTGLGSVDKSFGILFGLFKGYIVAVCIFSLLNWFYSYEKWSISTKKAFSFNIIKKGSDLLIEEFPNYKDIINTKEEFEKI